MPDSGDTPRRGSSAEAPIRGMEPSSQTQTPVALHVHPTHAVHELPEDNKAMLRASVERLDPNLVPLVAPTAQPQTAMATAGLKGPYGANGAGDAVAPTGAAGTQSSSSSTQRLATKHQRSASSKGSGSNSLMDSIGGSLPNLFGGSRKSSSGSTGSTRANDTLAAPAAQPANAGKPPASASRTGVFSSFMARSRRSISVGGPIPDLPVITPTASPPPGPLPKVPSQTSVVGGSGASGAAASASTTYELAHGVPHPSASNTPDSSTTSLAEPFSTESPKSNGSPPHHFRRSYSTSSIRMMTKAEVGPADFVKVRLLGKGDVGKVYLVKRKDTGKLYAMKGSLQGVGRVLKRFVRQLLVYSALEKRNDQTE